MKSIRIMGLCLVAVFALAAIAAASASATPRFAVCVKHGPGLKYDNATCSAKNAKESKNKYGIAEGLGKGVKVKEGKKKTIKHPFTDTAGAGALHSYGAPAVVECTASSGKGDLEAPNKVIDDVQTFTGCNVGGAPCGTGGTITTAALEGEYVDEAGGTVVGLTLSPTPPAVYFAEFTCALAGVSIRTAGTAIGVQTGNVNTISTTSKTAYNQSGGIAEYTSLEGGVPFEKSLFTQFNTGSGWEPTAPGTPSGEETTATNTGEAVEILAP